MEFDVVSWVKLKYKLGRKLGFDLGQRKRDDFSLKVDSERGKLLA
jgi:hypothetical protein